jgi:hypothetical protein
VLSLRQSTASNLLGSGTLLIRTSFVDSTSPCTV